MAWQHARTLKGGQLKRENEYMCMKITTLLMPLPACCARHWAFSMLKARYRICASASFELFT